MTSPEQQPEISRSQFLLEVGQHRPLINHHEVLLGRNGQAVVGNWWCKATQGDIFFVEPQNRVAGAIQCASCAWRGLILLSENQAFYEGIIGAETGTLPVG